MRAGLGLLVGWLLSALVLLGVDGRLPVFVAWVTPTSLLALWLGALIRQQRAPSFLDRPSVPERYGVADDLQLPLLMSWPRPSVKPNYGLDPARERRTPAIRAGRAGGRRWW